MTFENPKLRDLEAAVERRVAVRDQGKRVALTNGVFDLLHVGHVYSLSEAAKRGDALFVAMNGDESVRALKGPGRPLFGERERAAVLAALEMVDTVIVFRERRLTKEIEALRPDVYVKSGDYTLDTLNLEERAALEAVGASIEFVPYLEGFSTTGMIEKMKSLPTDDTD